MAPITALDRHIAQKIEEAAFFLRLMQTTEDDLLSRVQFPSRVFTDEHMPVVRQFQYFFSAFASAWQCVANYMKGRCHHLKHGGDDAAWTWYLAIWEDAQLYAFRLLRNADIHDETIDAATSTSIDFANQSVSRSFSLADASLQSLTQFERKLYYIPELTAPVTLELASSVLSKIRSIAADGLEKGYLIDRPTTTADRMLSIGEYVQALSEQLSEFVDPNPSSDPRILQSFRKDDRRAVIEVGTHNFPLDIRHGIVTLDPEPVHNLGPARSSLPRVSRGIRTFLLSD